MIHLREREARSLPPQDPTLHHLAILQPGIGIVEELSGFS